MRPHIPEMEELLNQFLVEGTGDRAAQLFISKKRPGLRTFKNETIRRNKPTMRIRS